MSAAGQPCSCCATVCSCVRFVAFLRQYCVKRKAAASCSRVYPAAFVRQTQGLISCCPSITWCEFVRQPCGHLEAALQLPCDLQTSAENARKMNMLKILRTTLRQPCRLAKRKMVLRLPQEIPQKCVRRQVHGCRRADVKRALPARMRLTLRKLLHIDLVIPVNLYEIWVLSLVLNIYKNCFIYLKTNIN